jgi:hypothetical protein
MISRELCEIFLNEIEEGSHGGHGEHGGRVGEGEILGLNWPFLHSSLTIFSFGSRQSIRSHFNKDGRIW